MISSLGQAKAAQAAEEDAEARRKREIEEEAARRNANMGILFASMSDPGPGYYQRSSFARG
jgi:hypothetical protein